MPVPSNLPKEGQSIFESVMESLKGKTNPRTGKAYTDEERARIAWSAVKKKYKKKGEEWEKKDDDIYEDEFFSELLEFKSEGGKHYFKGYLSTPDIDLVNDMVTPECMRDMLNQINTGLNGSMRGIKGSEDHDVYHMQNTHLVPISKITAGTLDGRGILVEGQFNEDHPNFQNTWNQVQNGFYDGLSIEYRANDFSFKDINGKKVRVLNKLTLTGYGHTPRPANPYARLTDVFVKSLELADAEEIIEIKSLKNTVKEHLHEDIKEYEKMIEDDKKLLAQLDSMKDEEKSRASENKEEIKMSEEEKPEENGKPETTQPAPQTEETKQEKVEETPEDEKKQEDEDSNDEEKCNKKKEEMKSLDEIKTFIVKTVKEELKSIIPEKKALSEAPKENPLEAKTVSMGMTDYIVKALGG